MRRFSVLRAVAFLSDTNSHLEAQVGRRGAGVQGCRCAGEVLVLLPRRVADRTAYRVFMLEFLKCRQLPEAIESFHEVSETNARTNTDVVFRSSPTSWNRAPRENPL